MGPLTANYKVADLLFHYEPQHDPLSSRSLAYRIDPKTEADFAIKLTEEDYQKMEEKYTGSSRGLIEYMVTGNLFYSTLILRSGLMLHSSAVELDGKAYLFSAPCGTGKSTHTALWLKEFAPRARILNDDKPAIRILPNGIFVYGTPWSGKNDLSLNEKIPLQGIAFLSRSENNSIGPLPAKKAVLRLFEQTVRPTDRKKTEILLSLIEDLVERVPIYQLFCNMSPEAAHVSYNAMKEGIVK